MWNARLNEAQAGIKIAGRNINNLRYANVNHSNGSKWRETKESVDVGERGKWKSFLKLNIKKTKQNKKQRSWHMIPSFHFKWKKCMQWHMLFSWAPKSLWMVTAAMKLKDTCSLEEKLWQLRQHITKKKKKSRHITLPTKVCIVKTMVFPVVKYGCENWTIKKAECQSTDAVKLQCWRRLLRVPWTARRSNQSILKEINPEYSLEGLTLKLKLWYFGQLTQRVDSLEKTTMLGNIEGKWRRGQQRMRWLYSITNSMDMSLGKLQEI